MTTADVHDTPASRIARAIRDAGPRKVTALVGTVDAAFAEALAELNPTHTPSAAHGFPFEFAGLAVASGHELLTLQDAGDSLHPSRHAELARALRDFPLPVVLTTHSTNFLDSFAFGEVLVVGDDGIPKRLSEHPESEKWARLIRTGEFWDTVGEDWAALPPPPPSEAQARAAQDIRARATSLLRELRVPGRRDDGAGDRICEVCGACELRSEPHDPRRVCGRLEALLVSETRPEDHFR